MKPNVKLSVPKPMSYSEIRATTKGFKETPFSLALELTHRVITGTLYHRDGGKHLTSMYCEKPFPKGFKCPKKVVEKEPNDAN